MSPADSWLPNAEALRDGPGASAAPPDRIGRLTRRQKDCLRLVANGYTSKQIGRQLGISYSTVDNHLLAAAQLLEVPGRAEAARKLVEHERASGQEIPRQPQVIAPGVGLPEERLQAEQTGRSGWPARLLPPIGGHQNDLPASQRVYAIAKIALFSTLVFVACLIVIRTCFDALR
jgi:DNA-binding CsgD family transcriptional regulator